MAIITDGIHITSTESLRELHSFADNMGIGKHWFHGTRKGHPHYDKPKTLLLADLLKCGAVLVRPRAVLLATGNLVSKESTFE